MAYESILYSEANGVACLTLNRPDSLNSFTAAMHGEVAEVLGQADVERLLNAVANYIELRAATGEPGGYRVEALTMELERVEQVRPDLAPPLRELLERR